MKEERAYDVIIIGGGVTGTAIAYALTFLKGLGRALLIEKNSDVALVNSHTMANSQTLHGGDTETNFSLKKALIMRDAESLMASFLERFGHGAFRRVPKMALGVGAVEVKIIRDRFTMLSPYYPTLRLLKKEDIAHIEPLLLEGRDPDEPVAALYRENGYAVDYHKLSKCFLEKAKESGKIDVKFGVRVDKIIPEQDRYEVRTSAGVFKAKAVAVAAGPYGLLFAHNLGEATNYTVLPVAGSFYRIKGIKLGMKVYTVQDPDFPFAAPHMDPDVNNPEEIRFGPTAKFLPLFERHHWATFFDFMRSGLLGMDGIRALFKILNRKTRRFILMNEIYDISVVGQLAFLKRGGRKIIPTLRYENLEFLKGAGGIRPQLVNLEEGKLEMGTGKIIGQNIIFDITPSPGASDSLRNAMVNVRDHIAKFLGDGFEFDEEKFRQELSSANRSKFERTEVACAIGSNGPVATYAKNSANRRREKR